MTRQRGTVTVIDDRGNVYQIAPVYEKDFGAVDFDIRRFGVAPIRWAAIYGPIELNRIVGHDTTGYYDHPSDAIDAGFAQLNARYGFAPDVETTVAMPNEPPAAFWFKLGDMVGPDVWHYVPAGYALVTACGRSAPRQIASDDQFFSPTPDYPVPLAVSATVCETCQAAAELGWETPPAIDEFERPEIMIEVAKDPTDGD